MERLEENMVIDVTKF